LFGGFCCLISIEESPNIYFGKLKKGNFNRQFSHYLIGIRMTFGGQLQLIYRNNAFLNKSAGTVNNFFILGPIITWISLLLSGSYRNPLQHKFIRKRK